MTARDGGPGDRTAVVRTPVPDPETVAAALRPDNTPQMDTRVDGDAVVTRVRRDGTGGLRSTVDDYVVNLQVATRVAQTAHQHETQS